MNFFRLGILSLSALIVLCVAPIAASSQSQVRPSPETAVVSRIVDGDTIDVYFPSTGETLRVRYIGVNTMERGESCYGEGTDANADLTSGQTVTLVRDVSETDRYGRLLRYVYVGETFVNAELVRQGVAEAVEYPPDTAWAGLFNELESEAQAAGRGCLNGGEAAASEADNTTLFVTGNGINVRSCEQIDCRIVTTMTRGTPVIVLAIVAGGSVSGNSNWYQVRLGDGSIAYIHSSLLGTNQPTIRPTSRPTNQASSNAGSSGPAVSTPIPAPVSTPIPGPSFVCDCSKSCGAMSSCEEAYFQLQACGCSRRDGDGDGVPCEDICR